MDVCGAGAAPDFKTEVSRLLTCENLEKAVVEKCGSVPLWRTVTQFDGKKDHCVAALSVVPELVTVLTKYFGAGANCDSVINLWDTMFHYGCHEACVLATRTEKFPTLCKIPTSGGPGPAPAPAGPPPPGAPAR